jgi:hypothetical protein
VSFFSLNIRGMFLKCSVRKKAGKERRSWSIVESRRVDHRRAVHRQALYLGERSDSRHRSWKKAIGVFDESTGAEQPMALFPEDRLPPLDGEVDALHLRGSALRLERPRQWGACWLAEWLDVDVRAVQDDTLYRAHDRVLQHREALFAHLRQRWVARFNARYEVLRYELTRAYFECDVPDDTNDPRLAASVTAATGAATACRGSLRWWSLPKGCRWPMKCCRAIRRTKRRFATCLEKSVPAMARRNASGGWTAASRPRRRSRSRNRRRKAPDHPDIKSVCIGEPNRTRKEEEARAQAPPDLIGAEALNYHLDKTQLRRVRIRDGCYLLRTNMTGGDPDELWRHDM